MNLITFVVPGEVRGKGRPRAFKRGNHIAMHTDERTAAYENLVKLAGAQAMHGRPPIPGAVSVEVVATLTPPTSWSAKKRAQAMAGMLHPTGKPDGDNVLKAILDGLNGVAWLDDKQAVDLRMVKRYGDEPGARVTIMELTGGLL